jgi:LPS-assembly lipoprotein
MKNIQSLFLVSLCTILVACGFQLRGQYSIPEGYQHVRIINDASAQPVLAALQKSFRGINGSVNKKTSTPLTIKIIKQDLDRRSVSITADARTSRYETSLNVTYEIVEKGGNSLTGIVNAKVTKLYQFNATDITVENRESGSVTGQLIQDAALQILRRYIAISERHANGEFTAEALEASGA